MVMRQNAPAYLTSALSIPYEPSLLINQWHLIWCLVVVVVV